MYLRHTRKGMPRRLEKDMHPILVAPQQLRPAGGHRVVHRAPQEPVLPVEFSLCFGAAGAVGSALLMGCACEVVFEFAAEVFYFALFMCFGCLGMPFVEGLG
jgi:hypothetical protein